MSMKFELHCHSVHSKGRRIPYEGLVKPADIAKVLAERGFSGFAVTDHDSVKAWAEAGRAAKKLGLVFVRGTEISTLSGHLVALGISEEVKPGLGLDETLDAIREQGGVSIAVHPFDLRGEGIGWQFLKADAAEVFNALNLDRVGNLVARLNVRRAKKSAVGGSDAHTAGMLGLVRNHMEASDEEDVLKAIKKGKVRVESDYIPVPVIVKWVRERLKLSRDGVLHHIGKNYSAPKAKLARFFLGKFTSSESRAWDALGYFSISMSFLYSCVRSPPKLIRR